MFTRPAARIALALIGALGSLLCLAAPPAHADTTAAPPPPLWRQFVHERWTSRDGLPDAAVQALLQTRDGYLWLGTARGLLRFDGVQFRPIDHPPAQRLLHGRNITALVEDQNGALWIGSKDDGLFRYQRGQVRRYGAAEGFPDRRVNRLHLDATGRVWIASRSGAHVMRGDRVETIVATRHPLRALASDASGALYLEDTRQAIAVWRDGRLSRATALEGDGTVMALARGEAGETLVGTPGGLLTASRDAARARWTPALRGRYVSAIARAAHGRTWIGTVGAGLFLMDGREPRQFSARDGLSQDAVLCLLLDRDGSLWIGTRDGLDRLRPREVETETPPGDAARALVWTVSPETDGSVWAGTNRGLVRLHAPGGTRPDRPLPRLLRDGAIGNLYRTRDARLWIAREHDLLWMSPPAAASSSTTLSRLRMESAGGSVRALFEDRDGTLWVAHSALGVMRRDGDRLMPVSTPRPAAELRIWAIAQDPAGALWFGGRGLHRYDAGRWTSFTSKDGLPGEQIVAILPDAHGLWIAGYDFGLTRFEDGRFESLQRLNPALLPQAYNLVDDGGGGLWLSADQGLQRVSTREALDAAAGRRGCFSVASIDQGDGLLSTDFAADGMHSAARAADGRLWFANSAGAVRVDPRIVAARPPIAPVRMDAVVADGETVDVSSADAGTPLTLRPGLGRRRLDFHYSTPSLVAPGRVRFRTWLEGFDREWSLPDAARTVSYTNLVAGHYRLRVQAYEAGACPESGPTLALAIVVPPFFHETRLFQAGLLTGLAVAGWSALKWRLRRADRQARALQQVVDERTHELREASDALERRVQERTAQLARELAQRQRLETRLVQTQKLEGIGRLAGGIAHDLNNLLNVVLGHAAFARAATGPAQPQDLDQIVAAGERAASLTEQLLAFAGRKVGDARIVDVNGVLRELQTMLRRMLAKNIRLESSLAPDAGAIRVDLSQLEQVILNLVINARDAMPHGGVITLTTRRIAVEEEIDEATGLPRGAYVTIAVQDTGVGMDDVVKAHLFEPFFTTKAPGEGTGLGLATCYGIVTQAGGKVVVHSRAGEGTLMLLCFPRLPNDTTHGTNDDLDDVRV